MERPPRIKIYGERNTGTNYLQQLLELNLAARLLPGTYPGWLHHRWVASEPLIDLYFRLRFAATLGWKHRMAPGWEGVVRAGGAATGFVTITKNPYSWLRSLYRRPYHYAGPPYSDFSGFVRTPWPTLGREGVPGVVPNPVALWNLKNRSYLELARSARVVPITYEELLRDPLSTVRRIATRLELPLPATLVNLERAAKGEDSAKSHQFYREYYLEERWKRELSGEDADWITSQLDRELVREFGYELLEA